MISLTAAQRDGFHTDGFVVLDELVDTGTVNMLRQAYDDLIDRRVLADGDGMLGGITRQVMLPSQADPRFHDNVALDAAVAVAQDLLGGPVERSFDMLIDKPPGHPHPTPWHQDMAYAKQPFAPPGTAVMHETVQFWIALDQVDEENGCMQFVPGVHRQPLLEHRVASGDPSASTRLLELVDPDSQLDLESVVTGALQPGGATVHSYGTPHHTPPNRSTSRARRAYIVNLRRSIKG